MSKCQTEPVTLQILIEKECARMGVSDQEFTRLIGIKKFHKVKPFIEQLNDYRLTPVGSLFECNSRY